MSVGFGQLAGIFCQCKLELFLGKFHYVLHTVAAPRGGGGGTGDLYPNYQKSVKIVKE